MTTVWFILCVTEKTKEFKQLFLTVFDHNRENHSISSEVLYAVYTQSALKFWTNGYFARAYSVICHTRATTVD